jgi:hypothetical protein
MGNGDFNKTVDVLGKRLFLIEGRAHEVSVQFQTLRTKAELLKIDIIKQRLENRIKLLSRQAGFKSITRDGRKLKAGLVAATAGIVLGGFLGRDGSSALAGGMSGFDGAIQELGKSKWAVSLDEELLVVSRNQITRGRIWITLESLLLALEELREKARAGEQFEDLDAIVDKMKQGQTSLVHLFTVKQLDTRIDS